MSFYTNAILINDKAFHLGVPTKRDTWVMRGPNNEDWGACYDGTTLAYRPCLSCEDWLSYMLECEKYLTRDLGARIVYLDEFGYGARICFSRKHLHDSPYPHSYGERELTRRIRAAVPSDVALCTEWVPEDTRLQFQDGYYGGGLQYSTDSYPDFSQKWMLVPMNMVRFAFPDTKCFNLLPGACYYSLKDGNWGMLKFVLFNGDGYALTRSEDPVSYFEERSRTLLRKMFRILHENAEAFTSRDVDPLLPTQLPGVYVNRFKGNRKVIWTVYNANYRTVRGKLLDTAHKPGAKYVDLWNNAPVKVAISGKQASLMAEVGPRDVACIVQEGG